MILGYGGAMHPRISLLMTSRSGENLKSESIAIAFIPILFIGGVGWGGVGRCVVSKACAKVG